MDVENSGSSFDASNSNRLEQFKGSADAPFEVVEKGEGLKEYPSDFSRQLKANWREACQLMNWKSRGKQPDWQFFLVAKDPFGLVSSIQKKIIENGGSLEKYGVDGKFGPETKKKPH